MIIDDHCTYRTRASVACTVQCAAASTKEEAEELCLEAHHSRAHHPWYKDPTDQRYQGLAAGASEENVLDVAPQPYIVASRVHSIHQAKAPFRKHDASLSTISSAEEGETHQIF